MQDRLRLRDKSKKSGALGEEYDGMAAVERSWLDIVWFVCDHRGRSPQRDRFREQGVLGISVHSAD
jgi:hypothetical protein